jgi:hypothetical protein
VFGARGELVLSLAQREGTRLRLSTRLWKAVDTTLNNRHTRLSSPRSRTRTGLSHTVPLSRSRTRTLDTLIRARTQSGDLTLAQARVVIRTLLTAVEVRRIPVVIPIHPVSRIGKCKATGTLERTGNEDIH